MGKYRSIIKYLPKKIHTTSDIRNQILSLISNEFMKQAAIEINKIIKVKLNDSTLSLKEFLKSIDSSENRIVICNLTTEDFDNRVKEIKLVDSKQILEFTLLKKSEFKDNSVFQIIMKFNDITIEFNYDEGIIILEYFHRIYLKIRTEIFTLVKPKLVKKEFSNS